MTPPEADAIEQPHNKPYMPGRVARGLERASYRDIALLTLFVWLGAAVYFDIAPVRHGIVHGTERTHNFFDSAYFVLVTLTSLGYGDYAPIGAGRLVSSFLVLFGLAAMALFVGKLASERSQAMVLLLHTSDCDRRLRVFASDIEKATVSLRCAVDQPDIVALSASLRALKGVLEGISNYVAFHINHSSLGTFGNTPALLRLTGELRCFAAVLLEAMALSAIDEDAEQLADSTVNRVVALVKLIVKTQSTPPSDWTDVLLFTLRLKKRPKQASKAMLRHRTGLLNEVAKGRQRAAMVITAGLEARVRERCCKGPFQDWPRQDHKRIAAELRISNNMVARAVASLKARGRLPK